MHLKLLEALHGNVGCHHGCMLTIAQAREQWSPDGVYLNTASYGLPPRDGFDAMQAALMDWRGGRTSWEHWGESSEGARAAWAAMVGVAPQRVAIGANVSTFVGLIAASLPGGARVVVPDNEFTSTLFPFLVQEQHRGATVTTVPPGRLAEAIDARTDVVAFSAVQMSTGEVADLDAIVAAARHHGARTLVDGTQACGWLPLDAGRFDAVVCAGY
jgi:selenocysteine lyase/cysteine desulfurase